MAGKRDKRKRQQRKAAKARNTMREGLRKVLDDPEATPEQKQQARKSLLALPQMKG